MKDIIFELVDNKVKHDLNGDFNTLSNLDRYLEDLMSLIRTHRCAINYAKDKLETISEDKINEVKTILDNSFNLIWTIERNRFIDVAFVAVFNNIKLQIIYNKRYFEVNCLLSVSPNVTEALIDEARFNTLDDAINYIKSCFLQLKESINYLEVKNADSTIHTIKT